jgi:phosphohistidine phosphatase SixA
VLDRDGERVTKEVRYWAATAVGTGDGLAHEVDEVRWLDVVAASERLDYTRDRDQLRALVRADNAGALETWPLALVRHARALPRSSWKDDDALRPLDRRGTHRAGAIAPLFAAYGVRRLLSSPSVRCADTLRPYAASAGLRLRLKNGLSEEGHEENPSRAGRHLTRLLERAVPAAVCSHGPVLPGLFEQLAGRVDEGSEDGPEAVKLLEEAADTGMGKGEVLLAHLVGTKGAARVVAVERHAS